MRRTTILAFVAVLLLALCAGAALAKVMTGTNGSDDLEGTTRADKMHGGGGRDVVAGWKGDDKVYGDADEDMLGGRYDAEPHGVSYINLTAISNDPGQDEFYGGTGEDQIYARDCEASQSENSQEDCTYIGLGLGDAGTRPTQDIVDCGPGRTDFASVDKKPGVAVDIVRNCERLKWTTQNGNDCMYKPWDNAKVACITGTDSDNKNLVGRDNPDARMLDNMWGKDGDDTLRAYRGIDVLAGGIGDDTLYGGPGDDQMFGDDGSDNIDGGDGDDFIDARDNGTTDVISCGGGDGDWVQIDLGADEKAPGVPFTQNDLTGPKAPGTEIPHDPSKAPAGCEMVWDDQEGFFGWGRKAKRGR
jgi:Ca2+-binding RTX toxin-like protein